ncbi:Wzz/FepE/Etk N-terminal domain-containing protein [Porticoccus litoralis]|uniref:Wzz/FepE/Etk N-terminal domain-containing protein n=1 Tax=Porticoccus litoralis TaxID=434086 RepID=A0AAW8B3L0_9GAMM|nr:Wzz/FepE/Etk N-terminal domain-containing protein [Porticoccus litoralis]MDP1521025.1 Wzz/FepE/Etk N-terminal domain-containing protein [Porticoccus litoralis]
MDPEQAPRNAYPVCSDEIDLVELFQNLWQQKLLIMAITVVVTAVAAAYAFLSTPVYETKAGVLPPQLSDIAGYNLGGKEDALKRFTVNDVYAVFKTNLMSVSLKRTFFHDTSLPVLATDQGAKEQKRLWVRFSEILKVKAPDKKNRPDLYEVMVEYKSPEIAAEWVNLYINMAAEKTRHDMYENVRAEILAKTQVIERQIDALRITAQKRREDRIVRLRDALVVAEAINLDSPSVITSSDGDLSPFVDGNLMYMRGAKAIRAELAVLEKRENDDPFISELRDLENQLDFLGKIDVNPDDVSVFTLDSRAEVPETPVKPKRVIILALGMILGGMLGVLAALVRSMLVRRSSARSV